MPLNEEKVYVLDEKLDDLGELSKEYEEFLEVCKNGDSIDFMAAVQADSANALTSGTATLPLSYILFIF